jgi:hypothetical protein
MASLSEIFYNARELVSLSGRSGLLWSDLSSTFGLESQLKVPVASHLRAKGYKITLHDNLFEGELRDLSENAVVVAPCSDIWTFLGITSPLDIPPDPGLLLLEYIGFSRSRGIVLSEVTIKMKAKHLHPIVDKLCSNGLVVKRLIAPTGGSDARVSLRSTIYHLKRFAVSYSPQLDGVYISVDDTKNEVLQRDILRLLQIHQVRELALTQIAAPLGFSYVRALRKRLEACQSQMKGECKFRLFSQSQPGSYSSLSSWYVGLLEDVDEEGGDGGSGAPAHTVIGLPLMNQVIFRLNTCATSIPTNKLRGLVGCSTKKSAMVVNTLLKEYGIESRPVQIGKQKVFCLSGPQVYPHAMQNVDELMAVLEGRLDDVGVTCKTEDVLPIPGVTYSDSLRVVMAPQVQNLILPDASAAATVSPAVGVVDLHALRRQIVTDLVEEVLCLGSEL